MNKVAPVMTLCLMFVGANCLSCLQGSEPLTSGGSMPGFNNTLQGQACPDDGQVYNCQRFDVTATIPSLGTSQVVVGQCATATVCPLVDCASVTSILGQTASGLTIDSCCVYCCSTDNCNSIAATPTTGMCGGAASFAHKLWAMVLAGILAVATISQLH